MVSSKEEHERQAATVAAFMKQMTSEFTEFMNDANFNPMSARQETLEDDDLSFYAG